MLKKSSTPAPGEQAVPFNSSHYPPRPLRLAQGSDSSLGLPGKSCLQQMVEVVAVVGGSCLGLPLPSHAPTP
jgi:hypothetical protein